MKGILKNIPLAFKVLLLLSLMLAGVYAAILAVSAFSLDPVKDIKLIQTLSVFGMFIVPAFIAAFLCNSNPASDFRANIALSRKSAMRIICASLTLLPCINLIHYYNKLLRLPEWLGGVEKWMKEMEEMAEQAMELMLQTNSIDGLLINILIVAVLAALSEEFLFRGLLFRWLRDSISNYHWVVWIIAILFSAIHMQFYGFIPRLLLGAYLGYLLVWTGSLWAPILAHFVNNLMGVLLYYRYAGGEEEYMMEVGTGQTIWFAAVGAIIFIACFHKIWQEWVAERLPLNSTSPEEES